MTSSLPILGAAMVVVSKVLRGIALTARIEVHAKPGEKDCERDRESESIECLVDAYTKRRPRGRSLHHLLYHCSWLGDG